MKSRHTTNRFAILRLLKTTAVPLSAQEIRRRQPRLSVATIYRNLELLAVKGEIVAIEGDDDQVRYIGHAWHEAEFRCVRCGRKRHLKHKSLPGYVDRKMFGHQAIIASQLLAQGLCGKCASNNP